MARTFLLMKHVLIARLLGCLLLSAGVAHAQAPTWQTAIALGTPAGNSSEVTTTAVDAMGNVYLAGYFTGTVSFGANTLTSAGSADVFVAKWHPATGYAWAQRGGSTGFDNAASLAVNGSSVYLLGQFGGPTSHFGPITLTSSGDDEIFVAKLTDAGSTSAWTWAQRAGGTAHDYASALAVSSSSVYVTGYFLSATADFGSATLTNSGPGNVNIFVAKLTDAGSTSAWIWAQQASTTVAAATALAVSGSSVYVAGHFSSATTFGTTTLPNTSSSLDAFVARLTDAGSTSTWAWAQRGGGSGGDFVKGLAVGDSSVYVAGTYEGTTAEFGATTLTSATPGRTVFVAKLTDAASAGTWTWAQQASGGGGGAATALAVSGSSVYVTGNYGPPALDFGPISLPISAASSGEVFVAKLADGGNTSAWVWAQRGDGLGRNVATALAVSGSKVYLAGSFSGSETHFGSIRLVGFTGFINTTGFLASLTDPLLSIPAELPSVPFTLAPNPAHHTATLTGLLTEATATLFDALGRAVRTAPLSAGAATLDVRGLPAGVYVVRAGAAARRLVVE